MKTMIIPPSHVLVRSTLAEHRNQKLAAWIAEYNGSCIRCQKFGPHTRLYEVVVKEGHQPDPKVVCDECDALLWELSRATPACLAVRWYVERRQQGMGQSFDTIYAAGLRLGRGETIYACEANERGPREVRELAASFAISDDVPHDLKTDAPRL